MTAPIWMASPPEVHSALLSAGPGPGPLLESATAWSSLSAEYASVTDELIALLGAVQAGAWQGPTAGAFVAAYAPYLAWLMQASADSAATAAQQEAAATAYTVALAAMPTLAELAANHTTHAALLATNFFGINTIPIALNEADYARMWIQAATVMTTYQAASDAAVATTPTTTPAPQILKSNATADPAQSNSFNLQAWILNINNQISNLLQNFLNMPAVQNSINGYESSNTLGLPPVLFNLLNDADNVLNSFLPPADAGIIGNPLTLFLPYSILGLVQYAELPLPTGVSGPLSLIAYDVTGELPVFTQLLPELLVPAAGNPIFITAVVLFLAQGVAADVLFYILQALIWYPLYFALPLLTPLVVAPVAVGAAALAASPGLAGLAGLAGLVHPPAAVAAPPPAVPPAPGPAATAPVLSPTLTPTPTPAPTPAVAAAPAHAAPPAAGAPPPPPTGPGGFPYLVGDMRARSGMSAQAKTQEPTSRGATAVPTLVAAVASARESAGVRRRRRATVQQLGRRYEYLDLGGGVGEGPDESPDEERVASAVASNRGAGTLGFAGTVAKEAEAAGLTTLAGDEFGDNPRMPMLPNTWGRDLDQDGSS